MGYLGRVRVGRSGGSCLQLGSLLFIAALHLRLAFLPSALIYAYVICTSANTFFQVLSPHITIHHLYEWCNEQHVKSCSSCHAVFLFIFFNRAIILLSCVCVVMPGSATWCAPLPHVSPLSLSLTACMRRGLVVPQLIYLASIISSGLAHYLFGTFNADCVGSSGRLLVR